MGEKKEAFRLLYSHFSANDFHCAHNVLKNLNHKIPVTDDLLDATAGFVGGSAFKGLTCSALTAGIMAVGLRHGEIEDSRLRVFRMLVIMTAGGNAFADHLNKFNKLMNTGNRMSKWFREQFGSSLCSDITQCEFSSAGGVNAYIQKGCIDKCKLITEKVASHAEKIML